MLVSYTASYVFQSNAIVIAWVGGDSQNTLINKTQRHHSEPPQRRYASSIRSSGSSKPIDRRTRSGLTASSYFRRHSASDSTPPSDVALRKSASAIGQRPCRVSDRHSTARMDPNDVICALRRRGPGATRAPGTGPVAVARRPERLGDALCRGVLPSDADVERPQRPQQQPAVQGPGRRAGRGPVPRQAVGQVRRNA